MEHTWSQPYRILEDSNSTGFGVLECDNSNLSWQPVYLAIFLTCLQSIAFLSIFEWGRRNKLVQTVYDRRRSRYPSRTPAPLMRRRGCGKGICQFEWWRIKITDEDYQKKSWDEFRAIKMEEEAEKWKLSQQRLANEEFDPFLAAAENQCYRESPFFHLLTDIESQQYGYGDAPIKPKPPRKPKNDDFANYQADTVNNNIDDGYGEYYASLGSSGESSAELKKSSSHSFGMDDDSSNGANDPYNESIAKTYGYGVEENPQQRLKNNSQLAENTYDHDAPSAIRGQGTDYGYDEPWQPTAGESNVTEPSDGAPSNQDTSPTSALSDGPYSVPAVEGSLSDCEDTSAHRDEEEQNSDTALTVSTPPPPAPLYSADDSRARGGRSPCKSPRITFFTGGIDNTTTDNNRETLSLDQVMGNIPSAPPRIRDIPATAADSAAINRNDAASSVSDIPTAAVSLDSMTTSKSRTLARKALEEEIRRLDESLAQERKRVQQLKLAEEICQLDDRLDTVKKNRKQLKKASPEDKAMVADQIVANDQSAPQSNRNPFNLDSVLGNFASEFPRESKRKILSDEELAKLTAGYEKEENDLPRTETVGLKQTLSMPDDRGVAQADSGIIFDEEHGTVDPKIARHISQQFLPSNEIRDGPHHQIPSGAQDTGNSPNAADSITPSQIYGFNTDSVRDKRDKIVGKSDRQEVDYGYGDEVHHPAASDFGYNEDLQQPTVATDYGQSNEMQRCNTTGYGHGEDAQTDYGYGDDMRQTAINESRYGDDTKRPSEMDCGYGDVSHRSAATDYGYGDDALQPVANDYGHGEQSEPNYGYGEDNPPMSPYRGHDQNIHQTSEPDYGYDSNDEATDYGYGEENPLTSPALGHDEIIRSSKADYGRGSNGQETDYGYGDTSDNNPYEDENEADFGYGADDPGSKQRNSVFVKMKSSQAGGPSRPQRVRRRATSGAETDRKDNEPVKRLTLRPVGNSSDHLPNRRSSGQHHAAERRRNTAAHNMEKKTSDPASFDRKSSMGNLAPHELRVVGNKVKKTSTKMADYVKHRVLMLEDEASDSEFDDNVQNGAYVATKVSRRKLSDEDQELLRCVGLDAFVTLRFLQFGFDVAFWPVVVSLVTLVPVYKTGEEACIGFFSTTVISLSRGSWRFWIVMLFGFAHILYILRRLWIEWEVFLPLRYEFLENGDFEKERYKEQYRKTCLVEFIPRAQKTDKALYDFFDAIFPGDVERAEVLLNTEHLRDLIKSRAHHILKYEDIYADKVSARATFLRDMGTFQAGEMAKGWCRRKRKPPKEPAEPIVYVKEEAEDGPGKTKAKLPALQWHYDNIKRLNREVEIEYLRLAHAQKRPVTRQKESRISKWLGIKYLTGSDTGRLHSSTAFVEFKTLAAKQHAIQCNITGMNNYMVVTPVPEVRDLIWDNMHVSRALIDTRKAWANLVLCGCLIVWSIIVSSIRNFQELSKILDTPITQDESVVSFLDFYAPALIVEGLVRSIPNILKVAMIFVRFKANSERDHYILGWYFYFRLITFVFIIIGDTLVDSSTSLVEDPIDFFEDLSKKVAENSQFFVSYVIVSGGIQVFFRLSQWHNLALYWLLSNVKKEEKLSQRKIETLKTSMKSFHLDEFIPLFIFIFMVASLYGAIAPLAGIFVAVFFKVAFKVFKFMTLYIYGAQYEGGGFLFYTISSTTIYVLYMIVIVIAAYLAVNGGSVVGGIYLALLGVVFFVQRDIDRTFVKPSKTLSLTKARAFDERQDTRSNREKQKEVLKRAQQAYEKAVKEEKTLGHSDHKDPRARNLMRPLLARVDSTDLSVDDSGSISDEAPRRPGKRRAVSRGSSQVTSDAVERFNKRYTDEHAFDSDSEDESPGNKAKSASRDFFIYRQPSLNKTTWETQPKAYREGLEREEAPEVWGDKRPEQIRQTARARRASIAMAYGG